MFDNKQKQMIPLVEFVSVLESLAVRKNRLDKKTLHELFENFKESEFYGKLRHPVKSSTLLMHIMNSQCADDSRSIIELVSNSCDAGATAVNIKLEDGRYQIEDNGQGMSLSTILYYLLVPKFSNKADPQQNIGRFGVGFFTALIYENLILQTKQADAQWGYQLCFERKEDEVWVSPKIASDLDFEQGTCIIAEGSQIKQAKYEDALEAVRYHPTSILLNEQCVSRQAGFIGHDVSHAMSQTRVQILFDKAKKSIDLTVNGIIILSFAPPDTSNTLAIHIALKNTTLLTESKNKLVFQDTEDTNTFANELLATINDEKLIPNDHKIAYINSLAHLYVESPGLPSYFLEELKSELEAVKAANPELVMIPDEPQMKLMNFTQQAFVHEKLIANDWYKKFLQPQSQEWTSRKPEIEVKFVPIKKQQTKGIGCILDEQRMIIFLADKQYERIKKHKDWWMLHLIVTLTANLWGSNKKINYRKDEVSSRTQLQEDETFVADNENWYKDLLENTSVKDRQILLQAQTLSQILPKDTNTQLKSMTLITYRGHQYYLVNNSEDNRSLYDFTTLQPMEGLEYQLVAVKVQKYIDRNKNVPSEAKLEPTDEVFLESKSKGAYTLYSGQGHMLLDEVGKVASAIRGKSMRKCPKARDPKFTYIWDQDKKQVDFIAYKNELLSEEPIVFLEKNTHEAILYDREYQEIYRITNDYQSIVSVVNEYILIANKQDNSWQIFNSLTNEIKSIPLPAYIDDMSAVNYLPTSSRGLTFTFATYLPDFDKMVFRRNKFEKLAEGARVFTLEATSRYPTTQLILFPWAESKYMFCLGTSSSRPIIINAFEFNEKALEDHAHVDGNIVLIGGKLMYRAAQDSWRELLATNQIISTRKCTHNKNHRIYFEALQGEGAQYQGYTFNINTGEQISGPNLYPSVIPLNILTGMCWYLNPKAAKIFRTCELFMPFSKNLLLLELTEDGYYHIMRNIYEKMSYKFSREDYNSRLWHSNQAVFVVGGHLLSHNNGRWDHKLADIISTRGFKQSKHFRTYSTSATKGKGIQSYLFNTNTGKQLVGPFDPKQISEAKLEEQVVLDLANQQAKLFFDSRTPHCCTYMDAKQETLLKLPLTQCVSEEGILTINLGEQTRLSVPKSKDVKYDYFSDELIIKSSSKASAIIRRSTPDFLQNPQVIKNIDWLNNQNIQNAQLYGVYMGFVHLSTPLFQWLMPLMDTLKYRPANNEFESAPIGDEYLLEKFPLTKLNSERRQAVSDSLNLLSFTTNPDLTCPMMVTRILNLFQEPACGAETLSITTRELKKQILNANHLAGKMNFKIQGIPRYIEHINPRLRWIADYLYAPPSLGISCEQAQVVKAEEPAVEFSLLQWCSLYLDNTTIEELDFLDPKLCSQIAELFLTKNLDDSLAKSRLQHATHFLAPQEQLLYLREIIQNAQDAGANYLQVTHFQDKSGRLCQTFRDDGVGMNPDTLFTSLLIPGVSTKRGEKAMIGEKGEGFWLIAQQPHIDTIIITTTKQYWTQMTIKLIRDKNMIQDARISYQINSLANQPTQTGTTIQLNSHMRDEHALTMCVAQLYYALGEQASAVPVQKLKVTLNGGTVNQQMPLLAESKSQNDGQFEIRRSSFPAIYVDGLFVLRLKNYREWGVPEEFVEDFKKMGVSFYFQRERLTNQRDDFANRAAVIAQYQAIINIGAIKAYVKLFAQGLVSFDFLPYDFFDKFKRQLTEIKARSPQAEADAEKLNEGKTLPVEDWQRYQDLQQRSDLMCYLKVFSLNTSDAALQVPCSLIDLAKRFQNKALYNLAGLPDSLCKLIAFTQIAQDKEKSLLENIQDSKFNYFEYIPKQLPIQLHPYQAVIEITHYIIEILNRYDNTQVGFLISPGSLNAIASAGNGVIYWNLMGLAKSFSENIQEQKWDEIVDCVSHEMVHLQENRGVPTHTTHTTHNQAFWKQELSVVLNGMKKIKKEHIKALWQASEKNNQHMDDITFFRYASLMQSFYGEDCEEKLAEGQQAVLVNHTDEIFNLVQDFKAVSIPLSRVDINALLGDGLLNYQIFIKCFPQINKTAQSHIKALPEDQRAAFINHMEGNSNNYRLLIDIFKTIDLSDMGIQAYLDKLCDCQNIPQALLEQLSVIVESPDNKNLDSALPRHGFFYAKLPKLVFKSRILKLAMDYNKAAGAEIIPLEQFQNAPSRIRIAPPQRSQAHFAP